MLSLAVIALPCAAACAQDQAVPALSYNGYTYLMYDTAATLMRPWQVSRCCRPVADPRSCNAWHAAGARSHEGRGSVLSVFVFQRMPSTNRHRADCRGQEPARPKAL